MKPLFLGSFGLVFLLCAGIFSQAQAASLYLDPAEASLNLGDVTAVSVRLNVDEETEECVNAVDGVLTYSEDIELIDISVGQSIFSMWVERPTINKEARTVTFAGGIPNGYCGRIDGDPQLTNVIAELIFRAPGDVAGREPSTARISFAETTTAYLNDGQGTAVRPATAGAALFLTNVPGATVVDPWQAAVAADTEPPAPFRILFEKNSTGKYYIIFNTTDKQTGVAEYQVMEQPLEQFGTFTWGRANAPWIVAETPNHHILKDQSLNSVIYVKALDKAGNEYIATYIPDESLRTLSDTQKVGFGVLIAGVLLLGFVAMILFLVAMRKRARKRALTSAVNESYDE